MLLTLRVHIRHSHVCLVTSSAFLLLTHFLLLLSKICIIYITLNMTSLKLLLFIKLQNMDICTYYFMEHIIMISSICTAGMVSQEEVSWKYEGLILLSLCSILRFYIALRPCVFTIKHQPLNILSFTDLHSIVTEIFNLHSTLQAEAAENKNHTRYSQGHVLSVNVNRNTSHLKEKKNTFLYLCPEWQVYILLQQTPKNISKQVQLSKSVDREGRSFIITKVYATPEKIRLAKLHI